MTRTRRSRRSVPVGLLAAALLLGACAHAESSSQCRDSVSTDPMPDWANAGFSPDARFPHVFGEQDRIAAVIFASPLVASTSAAPVNKVLLIARDAEQGSDPLSIDAQLVGGGDLVHRQRVLGPGSLDMPAAGCWRMELSWGEETDVLHLEYQAAQ